MKISRNWLADYISSDKTDNQLVDMFTQLGLECTVYKRKNNFSDVVIGKVLKCVKHPNADKLKLCKIDLGNKIEEIICGAPNIKKGLTVPVAIVGSEIGDFKIKKAKIRDVYSNGMVCSGKELGINEDNDGIMILSDSLSAGKNIIEALNLKEDSIFDFDITPNRGDCFSHLGIARELAIIEDSELELEEITFNSSDFKTSDLINVNIFNGDLCPRYSCRVIKNIKVQESPQWLKHKMALIGQKSINNIVDLANYIMFDLGQPLHTFDYDKLNGKIIEVRHAQKNEEILCLNNELNKLSNDDIVIADSKGPIAIAGVIGGFDSQVDKDTTSILLESAVFNEVSIRKTAKKYDYAKEASKRFERGVDYNQVIYVMDKFTKLLLDMNDGESSDDFVDNKAKEKDIKTIEFNYKKCNNFLGLALNLDEYNDIFSKLSINVKNKKDMLLCSIPSYRNDLDREIDLYEEVARVFGYDNIPISQVFNNSYSSIIDNAQDIHNHIRSTLCSKGFYEHYSNSLYNDKVLKDFNLFETSEIINESSQDMKYMRNSLMPGLLKAVSFNEKRGQNYFKLFEIGRVHSTIKSYNKEENTIGLVWFGQHNEHWNSKFVADIFYAKGEVLSILKQLKVNEVHFKIEESKLSEININIYSKKSCIGYLRLLDIKLKEKYDIKGPIVFSEISIDKINENVIKDFRYRSISPFPFIKRDISILLKKEIQSADIINCIYNATDTLLIDTNVFDVYSGKELDKDSKSLAISLTFQSEEKTLVDKDVDDRVLSILDSLKNKFDIVQR